MTNMHRIGIAPGLERTCAVARRGVEEAVRRGVEGCQALYNCSTGYHPTTDLLPALDRSMTPI